MRLTTGMQMVRASTSDWSSNFARKYSRKEDMKIKRTRWDMAKDYRHLNVWDFNSSSEEALDYYYKNHYDASNSGDGSMP